MTKVRGQRVRRTAIAIAAVGITVGAVACSTSGTHHGAHSYVGAPGTWTVVSCQVDVTYIDDTNMVDHFVPDTDANFRRHYAGNAVSGDAGLAIVVTFVNNTGGPASLPAGLVVSFTDQSGNHVGNPQTFNNTNGSGYGAAVVNGQGSGEAFSSRTLFSQGQAVTESPDIGASVPQQPDLNCQVSHQALAGMSTLRQVTQPSSRSYSLMSMTTGV